MSLARAVLSRPGNVGSRTQGAVRPLLSAPRRSFVVYRPKWADNRAVMPDQWGTRIAVIYQNSLKLLTFSLEILHENARNRIRSYFPLHRPILHVAQVLRPTSSSRVHLSRARSIP